MESYEKQSTNNEKNNLDARGMISREVVAFAKQPEDNPANLDFDKYTLPIISHDYPAKTPVMWNSAYKEFGIKAGNVMVVGEPLKSPEILDVLRVDKKYIGGGVGVGFKDEVIRYLDEIEPIAKEIGSVNLIRKTEDGKLKGFNTDGVGYTESLNDLFKDRGESLKNKKIVVIGSGGTANSIIFNLVMSGANVVILNRTIAKAERLSNKINTFFEKDNLHSVTFGGEGMILDESVNADVILNVSTKGSSGDFEDYSALAPIQLPLGESSKINNLKKSEEVLSKINKDTVISDIVLGVSKTPMLKRAEDLGFSTLNGIPMVVNQGVEAFWLIHGKELDTKGITKSIVAEVMSKAAGL